MIAKQTGTHIFISQVVLDKKKSQCLQVHYVNTPRGYKTFFMLNSAEHEIFSANEYENAKHSWLFILISRKNFMLSYV